MVFRRRGRADDPDDPGGRLASAADSASSDDDRDSAPDDGAVETPRTPTAGPYDAEDEPADDIPRLDLGGLRVPVPEGVELRLEIDQESNTVVAAVAVIGPNALQLGAFAAPKTAGIWAEVAQEIADGLSSAGGSGAVVDGVFGRELHGQIPMEGSHGQRVLESARFIGVDGPRWFLRGLFQGPAASDPAQARRLEEVFRGVVVVRGTDAMAPRDAIPLHMPRDDTVVGEAAGEDDGAENARPDLDPFERGPEITETR